MYRLNIAPLRPNQNCMHRVRRKLLGSRVLLVACCLLAFAFCLLPSAAAQSTGGLKGKVRTSSGNGIAGASVTVRQKGSDVRSATTSEKGEFLLDGLESGLYNLVFDAKGYSSGVLYNVEVKKKKISDLGDRLMLSSDQGTQVIVKGSVFFKEGTSVTGAKVELERVNSDGSTQKLASSLTNISGEFTFRRPEGNAKLRITAKFNGVTGSKVIDVSEAAIYRLAITLETSRSEK